MSVIRAVAPYIFSLDLTRAKLRNGMGNKPPAILDVIGGQLRALNLSYADWDHPSTSTNKIFNLILDRFKGLEFLSVEHCGSVKGKCVSKVLCGLERLGDVRFGTSAGVFSAKWVDETRSPVFSATDAGLLTHRQWLSLQSAVSLPLPGISTSAFETLPTIASKFHHLSFDMQSISDTDFEEFDPFSVIVLVCATFPVGLFGCSSVSANSDAVQTESANT
jgi:hypothetical protein